MYGSTTYGSITESTCLCHGREIDATFVQFIVSYINLEISIIVWNNFLSIVSHVSWMVSISILDYSIQHKWILLPVASVWLFFEGPYDCLSNCFHMCLLKQLTGMFMKENSRCCDLESEMFAFITEFDSAEHLRLLSARLVWWCVYSSQCLVVHLPLCTIYNNFQEWNLSNWLNYSNFELKSFQ